MAVWFVRVDELVREAREGNGGHPARLDRIDELARFVHQSHATHRALARQFAELEARLEQLPARPGLHPGPGTKS